MSNRGYWWADQNSPRLSIRRAELVEVDDRGEHQVATAMGYADETFKLAHRVQPFGFSAHPPKGSHGLALVGNGRTDQSVFLGIEHPEHRPKGLEEGESVLYNAHGDKIFVYKRKIKTVTQTWELEATTMKIKAAIEIEGNISQVGGISSTGVHQAAGHT